MKPNSRGEIKASENVLKMMKTESGRTLEIAVQYSSYFPTTSNQGEELRKLLLSQGTFDKVEVHLQQQRTEEDSDTLRGGWHNKVSLAKEGWTQYPSCNI